MPSLPRSGTMRTSVAPVQASIAGFSRCVEPTAEKLNGLAVPETLYSRYETLLYILHWPGFAWHHTYSCGVTYIASALYLAPGLRVVTRSLISTRILCDGPVCVWPVWSLLGVALSLRGSKPVNGLIQAR